MSANRSKKAAPEDLTRSYVREIAQIFRDWQLGRRCCFSYRHGIAPIDYDVGARAYCEQLSRVIEPMIGARDVRSLVGAAVQSCFDEHGGYNIPPDPGPMLEAIHDAIERAIERCKGGERVSG